jgi:hypothetical protein
MVVVYPHSYQSREAMWQRLAVRWVQQFGSSFCTLAVLLIVMPLGLILMVRGEDLTRRMLGIPCGEQQLLLAAKGADREGVAHALAGGANPNVVDDDGEAAVTWAAASGSTGCVEELISAGADPNAKSERGLTPLSVAATMGRVEVTQFLLRHGADPNSAAQRLGTPLFQAVLQEHEEIVALLLARGADPDLAFEDGTTPLRQARTQIGSQRIVSLLLAAGAHHEVQQISRLGRINSTASGWLASASPAGGS